MQNDECSDSPFIIHHLLFYDPQQMRHFINNTACRRRIGPRDRLIQLCDAETLDDLFLLFRVSDHAPVILDFDLSVRGCFCFLCHRSIPILLPVFLATGQPQLGLSF